MLSVKIAYNNSCSEKNSLELLKVNPMFELFNEDNPKELKQAWKYKGEAGARELPYFGIYEDGKLIKGFYKEDNSSTYTNLVNWLNEYINTHAKKGYMKVTKIEGSEESYKLGTEHRGHTEAFCEGIGLRLIDGFRWFNTSIIKSIDWENKTFKTLNSTYKFELNESTSSKENS